MYNLFIGFRQQFYFRRMTKHEHVEITPSRGDKRKAGLNCISHLLQQVAYDDLEHSPIVLPEREHNPDYVRQPAPKEMYVPAIY